MPLSMLQPIVLPSCAAQGKPARLQMATQVTAVISNCAAVIFVCSGLQLPKG